MPKKASKNRSSKQTRQNRQAKARAGRQNQQADAILEATEEALPAALGASQFRVLVDDQEVLVTLEDIRHRVNADLVPDGEMPLDNDSAVADMIRDEVLMGLVFLHPDGLWRMPSDYLPKAGQA